MRNVRKERGEEEVVVVMVRKMLCEKKINKKNKQKKTNRHALMCRLGCSHGRGRCVHIMVEIELQNNQ